MDFPDLPELPDAVTGAVIAGAFALVGQSLVKVWEVRQHRRDELTKIYAERFSAVQSYSNAATSLASNTRWIENTRERIERDWGRAALSEDQIEQSQRFYHERLHDAEQRLRDQETRLEEAQVELTKTNVLWRLYAKRPLIAANERLESQLDSMDDGEDNYYSTAQAADSWLRTARWELNASGSVGVSLILYSLLSLSYLFGSGLLLIIEGVFFVLTAPFMFFDAIAEWRTDRREQKEYERQRREARLRVESRSAVDKRPPQTDDDAVAEDLH